jgi:hypothetical protein
MARATTHIQQHLDDVSRKLQGHSESLLTAIDNLRHGVHNGASLADFESLYRSLTDTMSAAVLQAGDEETAFDIYDVMLTMYARLAAPVRALYPTATCVFDNALYFKS